MSLAFVFPGPGLPEGRDGQGAPRPLPRGARGLRGRRRRARLDALQALLRGAGDGAAAHANTQPAILTVSLAAHAVLAKRVPPPALRGGPLAGRDSARSARWARCPSRRGAGGARARPASCRRPSRPGRARWRRSWGSRRSWSSRPAARRPREPKSVQPANFNEPGQTVISGHAAAVARAGEKALALGAKRVLPLAGERPLPQRADGAGARPAARGCSAGLPGKAPAAPVVTNVEAEPNADPARIVELLVAQVTAPVRWTECVRALRALGVDRVVEVGPGACCAGWSSGSIAELASFQCRRLARRSRRPWPG